MLSWRINCNYSCCNFSRVLPTILLKWQDTNTCKVKIIPLINAMTFMEIIYVYNVWYMTMTKCKKSVSLQIYIFLLAHEEHAS